MVLLQSAIHVPSGPLCYLQLQPWTLLNTADLHLCEGMSNIPPDAITALTIAGKEDNLPPDGATKDAIFALPATFSDPSIVHTAVAAYPLLKGVIARDTELMRGKPKLLLAQLEMVVQQSKGQHVSYIAALQSLGIILSCPSFQRPAS